MDLLLTLFLCGDVMTGRGVDQAFAASVDPALHEPYVKNARRYLELAEQASGPVVEEDDPLTPREVWGEALGEIAERSPAASVINLETAVTTSDDAWRGKGIHYRMHPDNVGVIELASGSTEPRDNRGAPVAAVLSNNHVLDWGHDGLRETIETLAASSAVEAVGAGRDAESAAAPVVMDAAGDRRIVVFGHAAKTSGVPAVWQARPDRPGVNLLPDYSDTTLDAVARHIQNHTREGDLVVFSVHWGGNWGYDVPAAQRRFARGLLDRAGVDLVHGHSAHHVKGLEVYRDGLILYGCGDLITDYEGIGGHVRYRPELSLLYFPSLGAETGELVSLELVPMRLHRMRLRRADHDEATWLRDTLREQSGNVRVELTDKHTLRVKWD